MLNKADATAPSRVCQQHPGKGETNMKSEKQTKISSVHFKYVGTEEQFSDFIRSVIKDYIVDDTLLPDEDDAHIVEKSA